MARIKAEVKEHAHQQRLARQHQRQHHAHPAPLPPPLSPVPAPVPVPVIVKREVEPARLTMPQASDDALRCIDLTADDETEDEEDADEPFLATTRQRVADVYPTEQDLQREDADAMDVVDTDVDMGRDELPDEQDGDEEDITTPVAVAPVAVGDDEETDESEVDEAMPMPVATTGGDTGGVGKAGEEANTVGVEAQASVVEDKGMDAQEGFDDMATRSSVVEGDNDDDEEEDEQWPELQPRAALGFENEQESVDEDMASTASEEGEDSAGGKAVSAIGGVKTGESLEDGEIFEEGAVATSPTAVKEAIALELQARAAATTKKKQKKRGRKKNKRKVEVMLAAAMPAPEEFDEFGRNVRHQPMPPSISVMQASHMREFLPSVALAAGPPGQAPPPPPRLLAPPHLMVAPPYPPMSQQPPLPPHDFMSQAPRQFVDDQIVRVNRHGGFEPFAIHTTRPPRPAIAPPFLPAPRVPPPGAGYRYVTLDYFSAESTDEANSPNRGVKRPLSPTNDAKKASSVDAVDDVFDLDSLRAAALKTKRKTTLMNETAVAPGEPVPPTIPPSQPIKAASATSVQDVEDPSLDALRMELLKSMQRKRREVSSQSAANTSEPAEDEPSHKRSGEKVENADSSPKKAIAEKDSEKRVVPEKTPTTVAMRPPAVSSNQSLDLKNLPAFAPPVLESPQFRPLTAMSQSIVIRLSLDDLTVDQTRARADSYGDMAARFDKVVDDIRAQAATTKLSLPTGSPLPTDLGKKNQDTLLPSREAQASVPREPANTIVATSTCDQRVPAATNSGSTMMAATNRRHENAAEAAGPATSKMLVEPTRGTQTVGVDKEQVVLKNRAAVDADILADPARLEAEHKACLASIQEADSNLARLDAEITALRLAIASREAESATGSSTVTACGA